MITDEQAESLTPGQTLYVIQPPIDCPGYTNQWTIFDRAFALNHRGKTYVEGDGNFPVLHVEPRDQLFLSRADAAAHAIAITENQKRELDARLKSLTIQESSK